MSRLARLSSRGRRANKYEDLGGSNQDHSSSNAVQSLGRFHLDFDSGDTELELTAVSMVGVIADDTFTVDQAVNSMGFGRFQIILSLVTGLCWMADSMEMMILSILSPALQCSWGINSWQQAFITTIVFLGMMFGSSFWGYCSDKYGRKKSLVLASVMLLYYGILSAFSPSFIWILILRGCVGLAVGCVPQAVTLYAEYLPVTQRAKCIVLLECFWALGACFEVLLALFIMPSLGWRWLLGASSLPLIIFALVSIWLPESARYLAASGKPDIAIDTLKRVAKINGKILPQGRFVTDDFQNVKRGRFIDLFIPELRRTTILLWFIWGVCALCYYGIVLMTTEFYRIPDRCSVTSDSDSQQTCQRGCVTLKTNDYVDILWTTIAEFPGLFVTVLIIDKFGRKWTMVAEFVVFSASVGLLFICQMNRTWLTVVLFGARGIISGVFQAAYAYTPEVYPTTLRAIGVGTCSGMARIGAMVTPFVAQVLLQISVNMTLGIYLAMGLLAAFATAFLPIETKDKGMSDSHQGAR